MKPKFFTKEQMAINRFLQSRRAAVCLIVLWLLVAGFSGFAWVAYLNDTGMRHFFWKQSPLDGILAENGFAYLAPTGLAELSSHEHSSPAQVFENGKPLPGPSNALHDDIRNIGKGSYSFWHDYVYFSTSDNSDPRTNGRRYEIRYPLAIPISPAAAGIIYGATLLSIFLAACLSTILGIGWLSRLPLKLRVRIIAILALCSVVFLGFSTFLYKAAFINGDVSILKWGRLALTGVNFDTGFSYVVTDPQAGFGTREMPAKDRILEDGRRLGPAESPHDTIRNTGNGAYSVWNGTIFFSSSDNSDPRANGRRYELEYPDITIQTTAVLNFLAGLNTLIVIVIIISGYTIIPFISLKRTSFFRIIWILVWGGILIFLIYFALPYQVHTKVHTWWFVQSFDVNEYETKRLDYCSTAHIDVLNNSPYNYDKIALAGSGVSGIIRSQALLGIFNKLTAGADTNTEKHLIVLQFIQQLTFHSPTTPIYPNGNEVNDPLTLIVLGDMYCGQGAMLAIDLFATAGYPGRMVQLGNHQIAEIYYDNGWHYFDTDVFGNGDSVIKPDGTIPSVAELSKGNKYRYLLDALPGAYHENIVADCLGPSQRAEQYPSFNYFSIEAYKNVTPGYYYKMSSAGEAASDPFRYGWAITKFTPAEDIQLGDYPKRFTPAIPTLQGITFDEQSMTLIINFQSDDPDGDLLGYKVFVSNHSRRWDYNQFYGNEFEKKYWANPDGWKPFMYENLFTIPPSDVALTTLQASENQVTISVQKGETYFITIMPFDAYGEMIGRLLFPESNEIVFTVK